MLSESTVADDDEDDAFAAGAGVRALASSGEIRMTVRVTIVLLLTVVCSNANRRWVTAYLCLQHRVGRMSLMVL